MSAEPSEEAINEFVAITNVTREKAIAFLKANNLDANRAIDAYFENPNGPGPASQEWNVSAGQPQETYDYQTQNFPSTFDTDSSDKSRYGVAPSRPPSRVDNRERQEGVKLPGAVEMSAEQPSNQAHKMTDVEREEHDMRQALAMSLSDNPDHFGQETGVVNVNGPSKFGPATRDHYEPENWALSLPFAASRDVCVDPDPEERKRVPGDPAFLRPSEDEDYLSGLVTILHAIPLARETLLHRNRVANDYGHDPQWWNGQSINQPKPNLPPEDPEAPQPSVKDDILLETQRLMAFLDGTQRAFGSSDSLANIRTVGSWGAEQRVGKFLRSWDRGMDDSRNGGGIFAHRAIRRADEMDEHPTVNTFTVAEFTSDPKQTESLYELIDTNLWADLPGGELDDAWFDRVADIFTVRLSASMPNAPVGIKIPATWYPDRYLESNKEYARELRNLRLDTDVELERLQTLAYKISDGAGAIDGVADFKIMMEKAIMGSEIALKNYQPNGSAAGAAECSGLTQANAGQFATKLRAIANQVEQKLSDLEKRKEEAAKSLKDFSNRFTGPSDSVDSSARRKFTLRGVCTLPHVMYVLRRDEGQPGRADMDLDNDDNNNWQWWRISFSVEDGAARMAEADQQPAVPSSVEQPASKPQGSKRRRISIPNNTDVVGYTIRRVREVEVLHAAKEESPSVLLVYASEDAVNYKEDVLPPSLQAFVNTDNESFEDELQSATAQQEASHGMQTEHTTAALSDIEMQTIPEDTEMQEQDRGRPTDRLPRTGGEQLLDSTKDRLDSAQDSVMAESSPSSRDPSGPGEQKMEMQERSGGHGLLASASAAASARNRASAIPTSSTGMNPTEDSEAEPPDTGFR